LSQPVQAVVNGTNFIFNLRFPGQYADQETGLFQNGYREYDPSTGRYVEADPLGLNAGWNDYNYVESNSLNNVDLIGLDDTICMMKPEMCGMPPIKPSILSPRFPDYITFQFDFYVISVSATYTQYGDVFFGKGTSRAYWNPVSYGFSISDGWMINPCGNKSPTQNQLNNFLNGYSGGLGGYYRIGGSYSINTSGQAFNLGVGMGGFLRLPCYTIRIKVIYLVIQIHRTKVIIMKQYKPDKYGQISIINPEEGSGYWSVRSIFLSLIPITIIIALLADAFLNK
jgi:RHS repeat-associated protein